VKVNYYRLITSYRRNHTITDTCFASKPGSMLYALRPFDPGNHHYNLQNLVHISTFYLSISKRLKLIIE